MRNILRAISLIICLLTLPRLYSQELTFESTTFDFGKIDEDGGVVSHVFTYTNSGAKPSVIVTAASSCGCTVPSFSRQPITKGNSSTIKVTFDPMDRPGKFSKTVQIITAPDDKRYVLIIKGDVTPRKKSVAENYPFDMGGGLRLISNFYALSHIEQGEIRKTQVAYVNDSKKKITIALRPEKSSGVLEITPPVTIAPGEKGTFELGYDLQKNRGLYGALSDKFYVDINGKESKYSLIVSAHAVDSFTDDERSAPPISSRDRSIIKFGELKRGRQSEKQSFTLENSGVSDLVIRDVDLGAGVGSSIKLGDRIEAGSSRSFEVWVDGRELSYGVVSRYITLTLNDPDEPVQRIRVTASIVD